MSAARPPEGAQHRSAQHEGRLVSAARPPEGAQHRSAQHEAAPARYRFQVFARTIAVERVDGAWRCWLLGADGKRQPMELAIPHDVAHDELAQYLYDIYHEDATPTNGDVFEIDPA